MRNRSGTLLLGGNCGLNLAEVHEALRANGIQSALLPATECTIWPEIWVPTEVEAQARALVEECFRRRPTSGFPWVCPGCRESNEPGFDLCWSCGAEKPTG